MFGIKSLINQEPTGICTCEITGKKFLGNPKSGRQVCFEEWNKLTTEERLPYYHPKFLTRKGALKSTKAVKKRYGIATIREVNIEGLRQALSAAPPVRNIDYSVQHHTADQGQMGLSGWQAVQNYHIYSNGWSDIGYHLGFDRDGRIYLLRPFERAGAHVGWINGIGDVNANTLGFSIGGNMEIDPVTVELGNSLLAGWSACSERYAIPIRPKCHRDFEATACPGANVSDAWLNAVANGQVVTPAPGPTPQPQPGTPPEVVRTSTAARDTGFSTLLPIPNPPYTIYDWVTNTYFQDKALGLNDISDAVPLIEDGFDFIWGKGTVGGLPYRPRTNNFDEDTEKNVVRFQNENGGRFPALLPADGLVGPNTSAALQVLVGEKWNSLHPPLPQPTGGEVFRVIELSTNKQMIALSKQVDAEKEANRLRDANKQSYGVKSSVSLQIVYTAIYVAPIIPPVEPPVEPPKPEKVPNWFIQLIQDIIEFFTSWLGKNK